MRDAFSGITSIVIIVVFLVLVSGYLAFNVSYTKAFKVKNKIISTFEEYEGQCDSESSECNKKIKDYMKDIGYSPPASITVNNIGVEDTTGWYCRQGYCYKEIKVNNPTAGSLDDGKERAYFKIVTQIYIDIPIINRLMPGLKLFQVSGDTKPIVVGW